MNTKPHWTPEEIREICDKATGLYGTLVGLTDTPREAAEIVCMIHMLLWLNHGDGKTSVDDMLSDYVKSFRHNYECQKAGEKGQMN